MDPSAEADSPTVYKTGDVAIFRAVSQEGNAYKTRGMLMACKEGCRLEFQGGWKG